jgi:ribosomal-protein-alanine N-acetyltransferase
MALREHSDDAAEQRSAANCGNQQEVIIELPENITIRSYRISDIPTFARHANNKAIWDRLRDRMPHPYLEKDAEDWIKHSTDPSNFVR